MSTWATRATATTTLMVIIQSSTAAMLITKARKAMGVDNDLFTAGETGGDMGTDGPPKKAD